MVVELMTHSVLPNIHVVLPVLGSNLVYLLLVQHWIHVCISHVSLEHTSYISFDSSSFLTSWPFYLLLTLALQRSSSSSSIYYESTFQKNTRSSKVIALLTPYRSYHPSITYRKVYVLFFCPFTHGPLPVSTSFQFKIGFLLPSFFLSLHLSC